jgi:cation diffusion facilitator CzcD-associated flavoprotein CzcO
MNYSKIQNVCIIGAGVSGLVAAKTFLEEGYSVTIFEKNQELGGVWEKSKTYPGVTTQTPREIYSFSDYPMPKLYPEWPTGEQVNRYLQSYAQFFGVTDRIQFNTEVIKVERTISKSSEWLVTVGLTSNNSLKIEKYNFDIVLICNGTCHTPNIPDFPGIDRFLSSGGTVLHSSQFNDLNLIKDKRLVVVGFEKSATDIATLAANNASECTLVFRQASWKVPRYFLGMINIKNLMLTRFGEMWFRYYKLDGLEKVLHTVGKPIVWSFWRIMELVFRIQFRLDACKLVPEKPIEEMMTCTLSVATRGFYKYVLQDKIHAKKSQTIQFINNGIKLENGEEISTDIVILGTGFRQTIPFLEESYQKHIVDQNGVFHLYRNLIHPDVPQMGFVGYNNSLSCMMSAELGSRWLVEYFKGNLSLPSRSRMLEAIYTTLEWRYRERARGLFSGTCVLPFTFHYFDDLMRDLGVEVRQNSSFSEIVKPLSPSSYKDLRQELQFKAIDSDSTQNSRNTPSAKSKV